MQVKDSSGRGASVRSWAARQGADQSVVAALEVLADAGARIGQIVRSAPTKGLTFATEEINVQGEVQNQLDLTTNDVMVAALSGCAFIRAMVSEEVEDVIENKSAARDARLAVCFDPLDGSSNIDTNGTIGSIFSVLELPENCEQVHADDVLGAVHEQKAAGYILYGPATLMVLTTG